MAEKVEEPGYELVQKDGKFEVRRYAPYVVAQTQIEGSGFRESLYTGFRRLADFIFGNNQRRQSIAMTAPVGHVQTPEGYVVTFAMPPGMTRQDLPAPRDERIRFEERPERLTAVLRFSGWARKNVVERKTQALREELREHGLQAEGPVELAQYDPPWTLPFLRRNEVQVVVQP